MSVASRQVTPSLLQIDSVLGRLTGGDALSEICRFLRGEFHDYRWTGVYRVEGATCRLVGADPGQEATEAERPLPGTSIERATLAGRPLLVTDLSGGREEPPRCPGARSRATVPIRRGSEVVGAIVVESDAFAPLDATDLRWLDQVGLRLVPALLAS